ncbi:hypothetical protein [Corynebacterium lizhenjunii]|uniref:hypothetical protein n=1 Tax=Corynebacterium lizhenjunii TaxID=2709394 RepID=UPI0013EB1D3A|nr:hypothetical protein [Corynebacterium lizhenjunii]
MKKIRLTLAAGAAALTVAIATGCGALPMLGASLYTGMAGDIAMSLDDDGKMRVHIIACDMEIEALELSIPWINHEGPEPVQILPIDPPQTGYFTVSLPYPSHHEPPVIDPVMEDPWMGIYVTPITNPEGPNSRHKVPWVSGVSLAAYQHHAPGKLYYNPVPYPEDPGRPPQLELRELTVEEFKHMESEFRPANCTGD